MLGMHLNWNDYIQRLKDELDRLDWDQVRSLSDLIFDAWQNNRFVFCIGNGGSAATAVHYVADLGKNTNSQQDLLKQTGKRLKILSLCDNAPWITALGNDLAYDQIFVQQLINFASPGDLLIAVSGSGNSPNILQAVEWGNAHGLITFGMTGFGGGKLKEIQKAGVHVALDDMAMVESIHGSIGHWLVDDLGARMQKIGKYA
jgi:D-sedoheptulose 7-phosphate isomerase